jgi:hypothetical protein
VLVNALLTLIMVCWFGGRPDLWEPLDNAVARLVPRVPGVVTLWLGAFADPARASATILTRLDEAIDRSRDETDPVRIVGVSMPAAYTDRLAGLREPLWRLVRSGREGGAVSSALTALFHLSLDDFVTGRWDEAEELAYEGLELCDPLDYGLLTQLLRYSRALVAAGRGEEEAARVLADAMAHWAAPRRVATIERYVHHIRALVALGQGDFEEAYRHTTAISPAGELSSRVPVALRVPMDVVEAAVRTGRRAEAAAHVTALRDAGIAAISPRLALLAAGSAAIAAPDGEASELFDRALAIAGAGRWPFELVRVQLSYGERLRRGRSALGSAAVI